MTTREVLRELLQGVTDQCRTVCAYRLSGQVIFDTQRRTGPGVSLGSISRAVFSDLSPLF